MLRLLLRSAGLFRGSWGSLFRSSGRFFSDRLVKQGTRFAQRRRRNNGQTARFYHPLGGRRLRGYRRLKGYRLHQTANDKGRGQDRRGFGQKCGRRAAAQDRRRRHAAADGPSQAAALARL